MLAFKDSVYEIDIKLRDFYAKIELGFGVDFVADNVTAQVFTGVTIETNDSFGEGGLSCISGKFLTDFDTGSVWSRS